MIEKQNCCGCTACVHICPVHCISMQPDQEGFFYPSIDETACIHCNRCEQVCPIAHPVIPENTGNTYVGYAKDQQIREVSSSGGIFSLAANWIFDRNGMVFGAAFDERFMVHHVCAQTPAQLQELRGSKYVQSDLKNTYAETKAYLNQGKWVLFTGTACQIAGLKKYLGKEYDHLLTIDVLCHGVPSPKLWELYRKDLEDKYHAKITSIRFRDKKSGWKQYSVTIGFDNGCIYSKPFSEDIFMKLFLDNLVLRPSCYHCQFKSFPRISDLTIGDCWGIDKTMPEMDDDKGTSVLIVHTEKGQKLLDALQDDMRIKCAELDQVLPRSADSRKSVSMHPNRKKYLFGFQQGESFSVLCEYVRKSLFQRVICVIQYIVTKYANEYGSQSAKKTMKGNHHGNQNK